MDITALTTLVGTPSLEVWSQAQAFHTETMARMGVVLSLKKLSGEDALELSAIGAAMLSTLKEGIEKAENTSELKRVIEELSVGVGSEIEVSVAICTVAGDKLNLLARGEMVAYLVRQGKIIELGKQAELAQGVAGQLRQGDTFCLATAQMIEMIGISNLAEALGQGNGAGEQLAPLLHKEQDSSYAGAILGSYGQSQGEVGISLWQRLQEMIKQPLKVKREESKPPRINTAVAGLALVFLIVMIGFGYVRRAKQVAEQEYASVASQVGQNLSEAASVADLNPDRARTLLSQSKQAAELYSAKITKEPYKTKAQELNIRVREAEKNIFKVENITLTPTIELSVLADGLTADKMYLDPKGSVVFADLKKERVVAMSLIDKSKTILSTSEVGLIKALGFYDKLYYGVTEKGVAQIKEGQGETKIVIEQDPLWGEITNLDSYAGNIYLLDKGNSEIWKYPVIKDGFGERRRWLGAGITLDLTKVSSIRVTGDIWFTTSTGKIERYSRGAPVEFSMEGFPATNDDKRLSDPVSLYVTDEEVYVLERGANRVVVFDLGGKYKAQYTSQEFGQATDLMIYKGKGYVLINNVVKEFGL